MEHQKSYVFEPPKGNGTKKRKRSEEEDKSWQCRKRVFERLWTRQNERINYILASANETTLHNVTNFITGVSHVQTSALPVGIITAGPNISTHDALFDQLGQRLRDTGSTSYTVLSASECPNLKTLLKTLITKATDHAADNDDHVVSKRAANGPKLLNYDLQLLQDEVEARSLAGVVVVFKDIEAFDSHVLSDAIDLLHLWRTRIPFALLFGVATSTDALHDRLSRTALRCLQGEEFDVVKADELLERVFMTTVEGDEPRLWLGPVITSTTFDRQKDHVQNAADFVDALKYAYMSHFFANQVSLWTDGTWQEQADQSDADLEALRMLPSFQSEMSRLLEDGDDQAAGARRVKQLLESPVHLKDFVLIKVTEGQKALTGLASAVCTVHAILSGTPKENPPSCSALYARAVGGKLHQSPLLRELVLHLKRADSATLRTILDKLISMDEEGLDFAVVASRDLVQLIESLGVTGPLRSEHDESHQTVRTTIIARKAQLSKEKSTLSKSDEAYSKLLAAFVTSLEKYLANLLIDPKDLCFNEIFIYDVKGPHRATFSPKTRVAIERALKAPHDYLACECCAGEGEGALSASLPTTALVYQLVLESGSLVNVSDLYSAYTAIVGDDHDDEDRVAALFQRSLAELKHLGMIKPTRKKLDHVAKVAWMGL